MRSIYTLISLALFGVFFYYGHYRSVASLPPLLKFINPYYGFWEQAEGKQLPRRYFEGPVTEEVVISFDERWVPHIYADNYEDALYAQGILHAYFRLWQMDITHRGALGRVSEVLGERGLDHDKSRRRIGMVTATERLVSNLEKFEETRQFVDAYLKGANAIIENLSLADYPLEFKLLNYRPETWTEHHMCAVIMAMNYDLCYRHDDWASSRNYQLLGDSLYRHYFPQWNPDQVPVIQKGLQEFKGFQPYTAPILPPSEVYYSESMPEEGIGSNNWAIHHSKTKNGNNILANDPHLGLNLPSVWYEMHFHLPDRDIYGVSFPGIPGITLGFNNHFAWGSTNVGHDVADWYRLIWKDSSQQEYFFNDKWVPVKTTVEKIAVKNGDTLELKIPITAVGRVPFAGVEHPLQECAFQWGAVEVIEDIPLNTFFGFNLGSSYDDFKAALRHHEFAAQNFVFADRTDNIALHVQGKFPLRKAGTGEFILDSIMSEQWLSFIPQKDLPTEHSPTRGYVSSANQHSTYPSYPYPYHGRFDDYRGRTIDSLLKKYQNMDIERVKSFQLNNFSLEAKEVLPVLLQLIKRGDDRIRIAIDELANWDYNFEAQSKAAVIFDLWWEETQRLTQDEFDTTAAFMDNWRVLALLENHPRDSIFDRSSTSYKEDAGLIVQKALENALDSFDKKEQPEWADYKGTRIRHIARIDAFSSHLIKNGGNKNALNAVRSDKGPSWRMIVELGNEEIQAWGVYPGGQSGNPGSSHYDDQISDWAEGNYYPLKLIPESNDQRFIRSWNIKKKQ